MKLWIPLNVLSWPSRIEGGRVFAAKERPRAYAFLRRAEHFLNMLPDPTEHDLADCLSNLRRCFTHRLRLLEKHYNIRSAIGASKKRHLAELFAEVGIIRPLMLKALLDDRNEVEYADAKPPSLERCREFAEAVWYLLRTTDSLLEVGRTEVCFSKEGEDQDDSEYWFRLDIEYTPTLILTLGGRFPPSLVSQERLPQSMELEVEHPESDASSILAWTKNWSERPVMGTLILLPEERKAVLQAVFEAVP